MHFEQPGKQFWLEERNFYLPVPRALLPLWFKLFEYFNCAFNKGLDNAIAMTIFFPLKIWRFSTEQVLTIAGTSRYQVQHKTIKASDLNGTRIFYYKMQWLEVISIKIREKTLLHLLINSTILADRTHFLIHRF